MQDVLVGGIQGLQLEICGYQKQENYSRVGGMF